MEYGVVIVAAGQGSRMGLGYNKVYAPLKDGRSILEHTIGIFQEDTACKEIVIVTDPEDFAEKLGFLQSERIRVTAGGNTRQESVTNGVSQITCDNVLIHDGARPFLPMNCLEALKQALETEKAACLMVPCKDTIKRVENGYIVETIERDTLRAAQTPQAFRTEVLRNALDKAKEDGYVGTDDCSIVEKYGNTPIRVVEGSYENFKVTTPEDLKK